MSTKSIWALLALALIFALPPAATARTENESKPAHALAMTGTPKYGPGFTHFDYVNPEAPKGGDVRLATTGTFDSFNPFIPKGVPASGIGLIYDTLTVKSDDEPFTEYGLLADLIQAPADRSWVRFHIDPAARFHDGKPVRPQDVVFSFNALMKHGSPLYKKYYADVSKAHVQEDGWVRFDFKRPNPEMPLILGQLIVLPEHFWKNKDFSKNSLEVPLGSGPYRLSAFQPGRGVTYELVEDYWAKDHPVNKGRYNFGQVRYDYYRDSTVSLHAFKSGEYDFRQENISKQWATAYQGEAFRKKLIIKKDIENEMPAGMQAFVFNSRRSPFKNKLVRRALAYAFDFEWSNKNLFYGQYKRTKSYFANSELASRGLPGPKELEILEPYRDRLPPEVFTKTYEPPSTEGKGGLRGNLRTAKKFLEQAGWEVKNGKLVDKTGGKPMTIEILLVNPSFERVVLPMKKNLERLGIEVSVRLVDTTQYVNRMRDFDFDMTVAVIPQSLSPGNEQRYFFHSKSKDTPGSRNYMGVADPVVDELVEKVITAPTREDLIARTRALDRVLLWGYHVIPNWHSGTWHVAYWNKFAMPEKQPPYALGFFDWWIDEKKLQWLRTQKRGLK